MTHSLDAGLWSALRFASAEITHTRRQHRRQCAVSDNQSTGLGAAFESAGNRSPSTLLDVGEGELRRHRE